MRIQPLLSGFLRSGMTTKIFASDLSDRIFPPIHQIACKNKPINLHVPVSAHLCKGVAIQGVNVDKIVLASNRHLVTERPVGGYGKAVPADGEASHFDVVTDHADLR